MSQTDDLFAEYVREHRAGGEAAPAAFLARAAPGQRHELAALIDAYLARAPRQVVDTGSFRGSTAERAVDELERVIGGNGGLWPALLPRLRDRGGIKRSQLVKRLAVALGVSNEVAKVGAYYHQMEQGTLPAAGVSDRVLDALGHIVGETAQALREAGRAPAAGPPGATSQAFARRAHTPGAAPMRASAASPPETGEWDEVDRLFRGG